MGNIPFFVRQAFLNMNRNRQRTLFVLFCIALVGITLYNRPGEAGIGLLLIFTGVPFFYYWKDRKAAPDEEIDEPA